MAQTRKKRPGRSQVKQSAMRITKARREHIDKLAAALAEVAPSTSPGSGFCVQKVAEQMRLADCWKKQRNKTEDMAHLLKNVFRN